MVLRARQLMARRTIPFMRWPVRIAVARLRPFDRATVVKIAIVASLLGLFLWGDYVIFRRLFRAAAQIEALTPFFALGLLENLLGMVFLVAVVVLFFSALTSSIGALFTDLDLEIYHAAPVPRLRLVAARWLKTFLQSSYVVVIFLIPLFAAFARQYEAGYVAVGIATGNLLLLLSAPVSIGATVIIVLVRYFPVRRVHQIAATLAIVALTVVVVGLRMARPERLFAAVDTDELTTVLQAIAMPSPELYPSTWLARIMTAVAEGGPIAALQARLAIAAAACFLLFLGVALATYFRAFVRARESSAPTAVGAGGVTSLLDRLTRRLDPQMRAMIGKEVRVVTRDAAQWSQLFMMVALLFIYLYNIEMMPLEGDIRAALLAYLNLGMAGFVIAAICLRFAYPSISSEGKQFWILASAPISYRRLLWVKVIVYAVPLVGLSIVLTAMANFILDAALPIWQYTIVGGILIALTLVCLGVGLGGMAPDFKLENPMEAALSLGGFGYLAISMLYVGGMMFLLARPLQRFIARIIFGADPEALAVTAAPVAAAIALSVVLCVIPMELARRTLDKLREN